jgi:ABC-type dipeptide/oligopeptide/nickel transport system permease subunit
MSEATLELSRQEVAPRRSRWKKALRVAVANPLGVLGLFFVLLIVFCAIFADFIMPHDPEQIGVGPPSASPSWSHPFGTDSLGTDTLSRTIFGARIAMLIGFIAVTFGSIGGTIIGIASGYFGGFIDSIIQRIVDALLAFPAVVLLLMITSVLGDNNSPVREFIRDLHVGLDFGIVDLGAIYIPENKVWGIPNFLDVFVISLAIGLAVSVGTARVVRGAVLSLKENVYIDAAHAMGASDMRIMFKHILPNVAALVVVLSTIFLPIAILAEAAISFLGIGLPAGTPSWGADLGDPNRSEAFQGSWWLVFFPGLALSLVVLGFNLLGDTFRDLSDPRLRGSGLGGGGGSGGGGGGGGTGG